MLRSASRDGAPGDPTGGLDRRLHEKYDLPGPRYTSYPTAPHFDERFGESDLRAAARTSADGSGVAPLSLYVHIPFCEQLCYYCACSKVVTRHRDKAEVYLGYLEKELDLLAPLFASGRSVRQLHLGGGTPTYLGGRQLARLMAAIRSRFALAPPSMREFSIEVDPRAVDVDTVGLLADLGFERMSIGVQDVDPRVQRAVNRIQPPAQVAAVVEQARGAGFRSINLDLIYGLPHQGLAGFEATLDVVLGFRPERLSVYNYAHLPERVKAQKLIRAEDLPAPETKLRILEMTIRKLTGAGYRFIGMDHFALPEDELSLAMDRGNLQRNFQGYSTHAECDLLGFGTTAIGWVGGVYSQNRRHLKSYYAALDAGRLPVERGLRLDADDRLRREVIEAIMCRRRIVFAPFEARFGIGFRDYFAAAFEALAPFEADGLLRVGPEALEILPPGRLLLRNIAMVFDAYLGRDQVVRYSRTV